MAVYKVEKYNKKKKEYKVDYDFVPSGVGFWLQNQALSSKEGITVRYVSKSTKDKMSRRVVRVNVNFPDGESWQYTLQKAKSIGFKRR